VCQVFVGEELMEFHLCRDKTSLTGMHEEKKTLMVKQDALQF
jgi:hypothetical protein